MNTLKKTRKILNEYGITANKRFGQNFLIDDNILGNIVDISNIEEQDLVLEIGPGLGNLTEYLLDKAKFVIVVEIDKNMIQILNDRFSNYDNFYLLNQDILTVNIDELVDKIEKENNMKFKKVKVVANLPYYITTPIIFKLLQETSKVSQIVVMVQKEVALRMVANPRCKDYGILSVMVQFLSDVSIEFNVPNTAFIPAPNVTSSVISLVKNKKYDVKNEDKFFELIHSAFAQRRKKMVNSLESCGYMNLTKEELEKIVQKIGLSTNARAEELTIEDFIKFHEEVILQIKI